VNAHRGGSLENVENTLGTFQYVWNNLNIDLIETDVQLTWDGHVILLHDTNLTWMFGVNDLVSNLDYNQIPLIKP